VKTIVQLQPTLLKQISEKDTHKAGIQIMAAIHNEGTIYLAAEFFFSLSPVLE